MHKEKDIRTSLITIMTNNLPDYNRIINPYALEENPEIILRKAYGIGFGPASNTERFTSCNKLTKEREIQIPFINQITTTDSNRDSLETLEDSIFNDHLTLVKVLENDPDLGDLALKSVWAADDGLEYLETDRNKYFLLNNIITIEFAENLT